MNTRRLIPVLPFAVIALVACGSPPVTPPATAATCPPTHAETAPHGHGATAKPHDTHADHHGAHAQHAPAAQAARPAASIIELPAAAGTGKPREAKVLVDHPKLKLASIILRKGTILPEHHATIPVTIMALQGRGAVVAGGERLLLDPTHAVMLEANVRHTVEPETDSDMVLLVHHLGQGEDHHK